jgi:hypothetical protein
VEATVKMPTPATYVAAWPIEDPDRPFNLLVAEASYPLQTMAGDAGVMLLGDTCWEVREDVVFPGVEPGTLLLVARTAAVLAETALDGGSGPAGEVVGVEETDESGEVHRRFTLAASA